MATRMLPKQIAVERGRREFSEGKTLLDNPYVRHDMSLAWTRGWMTARDKANAPAIAIIEAESR